MGTFAPNPAESQAGCGPVVVKPVFVRLNPQECLARLVQAPIGRVAVRSVRFALIGDSAVFRVIPGSRLRRAVAGAVIAFHADHCDERERQGWSVVIQGLADEVKDPTTVAQLRALPLQAWADPPTDDQFMRLPTAVISGEHVQMPTLR